jgi:hypothetical protein
MGYGIITFGALTGGPGGGGILGQVDPLNWTGLWIFAGVSTCVAGIVFGMLRVAKYGFKLNIKA